MRCTLRRRDWVAFMQAPLIDDQHFFRPMRPPAPDGATEAG